MLLLSLPSAVAAPPDPLARELVAMIELALARAGYSHKVAAAEMGKDESQLSRELGSGTLRLRDLFRLKSAFWTEFLVLLGQRYGMQVTSEDAAVRAVSEGIESLGRITRQLVALRPRHAHAQDRKSA